MSNNIKREVMKYAWKLARMQAKKDNCTARECFAWALAQAWNDLQKCNACFSYVGIRQAYSIEEVYNDDVLVPLPVVLAMHGYMEQKFVLAWDSFNAFADSEHEIFAYETTGQRFASIEEARNALLLIETQLGWANSPWIVFVATGLRKGV